MVQTNVRGRYSKKVQRSVRLVSIFMPMVKVDWYLGKNLKKICAVQVTVTSGYGDELKVL